MKIKEIYHIKLRWLGILFMLLPLFTSCIREEEFNNSPQGNFEALWKIIDEQYCFLDYKQGFVSLEGFSPREWILQGRV